MDGSSGDEPRSWQKRDGKEEEKKWIVKKCVPLLISRSLQMCAQKYREWQEKDDLPHILTGQCYLLGDNLKVGPEERTWRRVVCDKQHVQQKPKDHGGFAFCQQGHGASFAKDGKSLLFGAPGAYEWTGEGGNSWKCFLFLFLGKS